MSSEFPLVSVVVPVFNAERFIAETVHSVLGQTFKPWELLLVDDGSTDRSRSIIREFEVSYPGRIRCLAHPGGANRGQFAARLLGARHSVAPVVALLDADDLWDLDYLEQHFKLWSRSEAKGGAMSYGPARYWHADDASQDFVQSMPEGTPRLFGPGELLQPFIDSDYRVTPCPSCSLVRRDLFDGLEHLEATAKDSLACEDQIFGWRIAARWRIAVHQHAWVRYRQHHSSSVSTTAQFGTFQRAELTALVAIHHDLAGLLPDHPLLTNGSLVGRIARLRSEIGEEDDGVRYGKGFFDLERDDSGVTWRWTGQEATLLLRNDRVNRALAIKGAVPFNDTAVSFQIDGRPFDHTVRHAGEFECEFELPSLAQGAPVWTEFEMSTDKVLSAPHDSRSLGIRILRISWS